MVATFDADVRILNLLSRQVRQQLHNLILAD